VFGCPHFGCSPGVFQVFDNGGPGYFQALTAERDAARGTMEMYIALQPLVALIAGILILMIPRLLNYIVAIYLIVTGILGLVRM